MLQGKQREDNYLHKGLRKQLVQVLREKGIKDERVISAIENIPRHFFLDSTFDRQAYEDRAFPIAAGQTISQPYTVAYMTELLEVKKFDKILEVGTGSAYQASVLAELGATVYTIERQKALYDHVEKLSFLKKYTTIKRFYGDGFKGLPGYAPFDKIIVTAGAPRIPETLINQLKNGGIMMIPYGEQGDQKMLKITKDLSGNISQDELGTFAFVPMLEGKNDQHV